LPEILIIHLLRFKKKGLWTEKITSPIDCPLECLTVNSIISNNEKYDLYAVSNHFGGTGGGHYTAYVKNPASSNWLEMDDSHVSSISSSQVVTSSAYILFYKRKIDS
jgi:ubiquitin carboxyl-terminal hydrolase 4/11/15